MKRSHRLRKCPQGFRFGQVLFLFSLNPRSPLPCPAPPWLKLSSLGKDDGLSRCTRKRHILRRLRAAERVFLGPAVAGVHLQRVPWGAKGDPSHGGRDSFQQISGRLLVSVESLLVALPSLAPPPSLVGGHGFGELACVRARSHQLGDAADGISPFFIQNLLLCRLKKPRILESRSRVARFCFPVLSRRSLNH